MRANLLIEGVEQKGVDIFSASEKRKMPLGGGKKGATPPGGGDRAGNHFRGQGGGEGGVTEGGRWSFGGRGRKQNEKKKKVNRETH